MQYKLGIETILYLLTEGKFVLSQILMSLLILTDFNQEFSVLFGMKLFRSY